MAEDKKGFILYADIIGMVNQLPNDKAGLLFKHILSYVNDENPVSDDLIINISFEPIKASLKRDLEKYERIKERNSLNGSKGGRPKTVNPKEPQKPSGLSGNPKKPQKADSDSDSDSVRDKVSDSVKEEKSNSKVNRVNFIPPTIDQVKEYCLERNNNVDPERFIDHYSSNGWMVGKNKMKDWKAAIRTWEKSDLNKGQTKPPPLSEKKIWKTTW